MKSNWNELALGDFCDLYQPRTISSAELVVDGRHPVYGANGIIGKYDKYNHENPQLLITCRGATCGAVNVSQPFSWINGNAMVVKPKNGAAEIGFLKHLFLGGIDLRSAITGAAQPQITRQSLAPLRTRLPPLPEQRRIAEMLDKAEALRAKRRAALTKLDTLAQSIFLDIFGDPETNPKEWPAFELQDVVKTGTIVTYGIVQAGEEYADGIPYIRTGDIANGEIIESGLRRTDPKIAAKFARSRVETGDIVMSIRATVGTTAVVTRSIHGANLTQGTARIAPGTKTNSAYLNNFIQSKSTQTWIAQQVKGATFREITLSRLREMPVLLPPLPLQQAFARRIEAIEGLKERHRASLAKFDALFASLQHRAFRGEL